MQFSRGRRGFLRQTALVVGAFVVGIGRDDSVFAAGFCSFCGNKRCDDGQKRHCEDPDNAGLKLTWGAQGGGTCVECYDSEAARAAAGASGHGCHYCADVKCGYYLQAPGPEEPAVPPAVDAGVGCIDPHTGQFILWPEPGDCGDDRSPNQELPPGHR